MSKGSNDGRPKRGRRPMMVEATPPPLGEELIAKLQNAVNAAQRKRMADRNVGSASQSPDKQP